MTAELMVFSKKWWLILLQGIISLILGIMVLVVPEITLPALIIFLGAYWLVMGVLLIIGIFVGYSRSHWGWSLFGGILGIIAGLLVMSSPVYATILLPVVIAIIIAIQGILVGIVFLISAFKGGGGGAVAIGILSLALGVILLIWPFITGMIFIIIMGILAIVGGIVAIGFSFDVRRIEKKTAAR